MNVNLNGQFEAAAEPEAVYDFITDPDKFAPILPYFKGLTKTSETEFTVTLEVGVPQIRGKSDVQTKRISAERPTFVKYQLSGRHALGIMDAKMTFEIEPLGVGSRVDWTVEAIVSGKLASLAQGILIPLANRQIKSLAQAAQNALGGPPGGAVAVQPGLVARGAASFKDFFGGKTAK